MQSPTISYLTKVQFGAGALVDLPEVMQTVGISRPLIVTDQPLVELGFVEKLGLQAPVVFMPMCNQTQLRRPCWLVWFAIVSLIAMDLSGLVAGRPLMLPRRWEFC